MSPAAILVVEPSGDVDVATIRAFRSLLEPLADASIAVVDLSAVQYIDSAGIAELMRLLNAHRERGHGGEVRLVVGPTSGNVARILQVTGLHNAFRIFASRQAAIEGS